MALKPQLFGTDGVRGVAGHYPLDRKTIAKLGGALGRVLADESQSRRPEIVLGIDTRESGPWIARALAGGLKTNGVYVAYAGVTTTPGVAFITRHHGFAAGIMVSASHNPFQDNGIKVFSAEGTKLPEQVEVEIERALAKQPADVEDAQLEVIPSLFKEYSDFLEALAARGGAGQVRRLVMDCGNGSASTVAPPLLRRLGISAKLMNAEPDGRNINLNCGSLYPEAMARETQASGSDLGVAFDGDADRAIFATRSGRVLDGDHVLFAIAPHLKRLSLLRGGGVVGTLMTNLGLELALQSHGIGLKRAGVGDKFVLEEMLRSGMNLGGEPSGHIIFRDISASGDGLVTLIEMLRLIHETGKSAADLVADYAPFPQMIRNVAVRKKLPLELIPEVAGAIARCEDEMRGRGRVVLRYSGTEPLARVMVEGDHAASVEQHAAEIAAAIEKTIGTLA